MISKSSLSESTLAFIGEQLLSPVGIILFVRVALIEQEHRIDEMVYSRVYPHWKTILYRIIIISTQLFLILAIAFMPMKLFGIDFDITSILLGSFVTSFYLGVISMTLGYITKEISVGALIPFLYYFFEMFSKGRFTKGFYLFGLLEGNYMSKIKLFSIAICLVILLLRIIKQDK